MITEILCVLVWSNLLFSCKTSGNGKNIYSQPKPIGFIADNMIYYILD